MGNGLVVVGLVHRADASSPQHARSLRMLLAREFGMRPVRIVGELDQESSANIAHARCEIVRNFIAHPKHPEWLFLLDSDMTFGDGILDELLSVADTESRPIVGGLCFGVRPVRDEAGREHLNECGGSPLELFPTLYTLGEDGAMFHQFSYPQNSVVQVHSTGAACLLVNRRVLGDPRWVKDGHPLPWFREAVMHSRPVSEDQFFCLQAGAFGFPVHVDTKARTGHVKVFIADEDLFLAQRAAVRLAAAS